MGSGIALGKIITIIFFFGIMQKGCMYLSLNDLISVNWISIPINFPGVKFHAYWYEDVVLTNGVVAFYCLCLLIETLCLSGYYNLIFWSLLQPFLACVPHF